MKLIVFVFSALISTSIARPRPDNSPRSTNHALPDASDLAKYTYQYKVMEDYLKNNFGQTESRDDYSTYGSYSVALPDGRLQTVSYTVNEDGGYIAEVSYEGTVQYPKP